MNNVNKQAAADPNESQLAELENVENDFIIGRAFWRSLIVFASVGAIVLGFYLVSTIRWNTPKDIVTSVNAPNYRDALDVIKLPKIPLTNITKSSGLQFEHISGRNGERLLPETMGGGGGFFDYDNDGDQDILFVNSTFWPWDKSDRLIAASSILLYQNDGSGKFNDVSAEVGFNENFYGMGPAFADFDGDGFTDIFVTAVGKNKCYRNIDGKRFEEVAQALGIAGDEGQWSCPALWFDYDHDNRLDLLVGHYVQWDRKSDIQQSFTLTGIGRAYGPPTAFGGTMLTLYKNTVDGFLDVSERAGIQIRNVNTNVPASKSLAMTMLDVNADGWMDVIVANDTVPNFLLINEQDGTFNEVGQMSGIALDRSGMATGAMGIDAAYYRNDDNIAVAIGNFANEPSSLYISRGRNSQFSDAAAPTGFGPQTKLNLTFGLFFADMDLDGRQDIICNNGHLEEEISKFQPTQQYAQSPQLFWNAGPEASTELVALDESHTGDDFQVPLVGRGASYADIDGDGDLDVLLISNGGKPSLFRNDIKNDNHWLRFKLVGKADNQEAIGALVTIQSNGQTHRRCVCPSRSYLSQCELPVTFGLGDVRPSEVQVAWPDGSTQIYALTETNVLMTLQQQ